MSHSFADTSVYEEVVSELSKIISSVSEECTTFRSVNQNLCDTTLGDPAVAKNADSFEKCIKKIEAEMETVKQLQKALQEEIKRIEEVSKKYGIVED